MGDRNGGGGTGDGQKHPAVRCNESPDDHVYFYLLSRRARLLIYALETDSRNPFHRR